MAWRPFSSQLPSLLLVLLPLVAGCNKPGSRSVDAQPAAAPLVIADGKGLLFSYFDRRAELRTVEKLAAVPDHARAEVMVTNPRRRLPGDQVHVTDLRIKKKSGLYRAWREQRGDWLDRNMPKLSKLHKPIAVAQAQPKKKKRRWRRKKPRPKRLAAKAPQTKHNTESTAPTKPASPIVEPATAAPKVVLFSTSWCPSCKRAAAFFRSRGIRFAELDVEKDPQAARAYVSVCQRAGLKQGAVPVIVVNGQVFQGFSPAQIDRALKAG